MKRMHVALIAVIVVLLVGFAWFLGRNPETGEQEEILVLCGGSMRSALEASVLEYREKYPDAEILTTYGGSGELCAQIQQTGRGDLYVCHDPFMPWAAGKGLIAEWSHLGRLRVVLVVPEGNPKGIENLADLARPGLRIGIGNKTHSTSGQIVKHLLAAKSYGQDILKNVRMETKGHQQRCNDVVMGLLDAGLVWDAVAFLYESKLDAIPLDEEMEGVDAITSATYRKSDIRNTGVTVGIIAGAAERPDVLRFYEFLTTRGKEIFQAHGFAPVLE